MADGLCCAFNQTTVHERRVAENDEPKVDEVVTVVIGDR